MLAAIGKDQVEQRSRSVTDERRLLHPCRLPLPTTPGWEPLTWVEVICPWFRAGLGVWSTDALMGVEDDELMRHRHTPEQIVRKLREDDRMIGQGG